MSVRDRIEDSKLLFSAGRLEGALISVLLAVAGTSRKRYSPATKMGDREAFERFLADERKLISGGKEVTIEFDGESRTLENILYKFVRNCLIHQAALEDHVSFDYGDFLLDKRGTTDYFTFSSELVLRLAYIVEKAPENAGMFPEGRYDGLPEPVALKQSAIVRFCYGDQQFEVFCSACAVRKQVWEGTGEVVTWLHLKGRQAFGGQVSGRPGVILLVPVKYMTCIQPGPQFQRVKRRTSADVGVFPPDKPAAENAMTLSEIEKAIGELQIPLVKTIVTVYRPYYEVTSTDGSRNGVETGESKPAGWPRAVARPGPPSPFSLLVSRDLTRNSLPAIAAPLRRAEKRAASFSLFLVTSHRLHHMHAMAIIRQRSSEAAPTTHARAVRIVLCVRIATPSSLDRMGLVHLTEGSASGIVNVARWASVG